MRWLTRHIPNRETIKERDWKREQQRLMRHNG